MTFPWERVTMRSPPYRYQGVADGPGSVRLAREQRVGDLISDDFVVAILIGWPLPVDAGVSAPAPQWEETLAREIPFQPRKEVIEVVYAPVREDEQANGLSR